MATNVWDFPAGAAAPGAWLMATSNAATRIQGDMTIMARFRQDDDSETSEPILFNGLVAPPGLAPTVDGYALYTDRVICTAVALPAFPTAQVPTAYLIPTGQWTHVAGRKGDVGINTLLSVFLNGLLVDTDTQLAWLTDQTTSQMFIGSDNSALGVSPFGGQMAEIEIYDRALSDWEINYNFRHPNRPILSDLVLGYTQETVRGNAWTTLPELGWAATYDATNAVGTRPNPLSSHKIA